MIQKIETEEFLNLSSAITVVDVRSPGEYLNAHIPGAVNIPLFDDNERAIVGTSYKQEGRDKAIMAGLDLIGSKMSEKLKYGLKTAAGKRLLVHCWRGGMRSESMAWLFSLGGIETFILNGGYKAYRNYVLTKLGEPRKMLVLGGLTGSGKTHLLRYLQTTGENVIDLEGLACHKGSAFGALGQQPQPGSEYFSNLLFNDWVKFNKDEILWVEDESRSIGSVFVPDPVFTMMQQAHVIAVLMDINVRMPRLLQEYSQYPKEALKASVIKISKRLGGDNTHDAIDAIEKDDFAKAIEITLHYYDKAYMYGLKKRDESRVHFVYSDTDNVEENSARIIAESKKIKSLI